MNEEIRPFFLMVLEADQFVTLYNCIYVFSKYSELNIKNKIIIIKIFHAIVFLFGFIFMIKKNKKLISKRINAKILTPRDVSNLKIRKIL